MPGANPLIHFGSKTSAGGGGTDYVTEEAEGTYGGNMMTAERMPWILGGILVASALGLWALHEAGFRFVIEVGEGR